MSPSSSPLSFSSTFLPFHHPTKSTQIPFSTNPRKLTQSSSSSSSSTSTTNPKRKIWKDGEFPSSNVQQRNPFSYQTEKRRTSTTNPKRKVWKDGEFPDTKVKERTSFGYQTENRRTPIKNIRKKVERKNDAKAWVNTVTEALSECIDKKQWLQALEVFEMLREQPFYQPKEGTYMKLLVLLGKSGQPERAGQLFDKMIEEGIEPTKELYTALVGVYCRNNAISGAFSILEKMKGMPLCQPDVYTYSILIKACVDDGQFDLVESLYKEMDERLITPNTVTQNIVLSGYGKAGRYDQMEKVLADMLASTTCRPDVWTMNTILSLFANKGQIEMMEQWYEKFRDFGIETETRTCNILISAYGKKRMYDKMSSVMEYMRKLSFPWTTSTYNNVIEAFAEVGDAKNMEYTFDQMRAEGMKVDNRTFCCFIRGYANAGLFHKVISSVQLAGKLEISENTSFYNAVIYACAKADDLMEMDRVFIRMKDKNCQPDSMTYELMIEAYRKEGMNDRVYDLEQEKNIATASVAAVDV